MTEFQLDIFAPSNRASVASRLRTCERLLAFWALPLLPPTTRSISALGAALKAGRYRSAAVYLSIYKGWATRNDFEWSSTLQQAVNDAVRSCERGMGGPVKARALPFSRLRELPGGTEPWVPGGPLRSRNAIIIGAWFLTREVELSTALAASAELTFPERGVPLIRWHLPASKTDVRATGTAREHGCACGPAPSPACPAHAAWDQVHFLQVRFPHRWEGGRPAADLPLFPNSDGKACTKEAMTETIIHAATLLGIELAAPDGTERVSGHSLRATGAQGLAAAGIDTWAIELLGRWGSDAVRGYIRDARLASAASMAKQVANAVPLEDLVRRLVAEAGTQPVTTAINVAEPLRHAVELARLEARPGAEGPIYVANTATGVIHRSIIGPGEAAAGGWSAACGWRYGLSVLADLTPPARLPADYRLYCTRCLPALRLARRQALESAAAAQ